MKEGTLATHWTRLSSHRFRANEAQLQLSLLAYNLGNLWRSAERVHASDGVIVPAYSHPASRTI